MSLVTATNINKIYTAGEVEVTAVKRADFKIEQASFVAFVGPSGSGKSTLLNMIGCLDHPTAGRLQVANTDVASLDRKAAARFRGEHIGFIFQAFNLFDELSVKDNVALPLIVTGLSQKSIDEKVQQAMKIAHISHKQEQAVQNLSGGEKQRCAIARALVHEPHIILCDEPTANLDRENSLKFIETLKQFKALLHWQILIQSYQGLSLEEMLQSPPDFIKDLDILSSISFNRSNGFASIYQKMKKQALTLLVSKHSH